MKLFRFIFYKVYMQQLRWFGEKELPHLTAVLSIASLVYFNILGIVGILLAIYGKYLYDIISKKDIAIFMLLLLGIFYYIFLYKGKYRKVLKEFSGKEDTQKMKFYMILYIVGTVVVFFISMEVSRRLLN